jgi:hypothetical protein
VRLCSNPYIRAYLMRMFKLWTNACAEAARVPCDGRDSGITASQSGEFEPQA